MDKDAAGKDRSHRPPRRPNVTKERTPPPPSHSDEAANQSVTIRPPSADHRAENDTLSAAGSPAISAQTHRPRRSSVGAERSRTPSHTGSVGANQSVTIRPPTADHRAEDQTHLVGSLPAVIVHATDENKLDIQRSRRNAVIGQQNPGPDPWSTLDYVRRRSFGMPNRITLDAERASITGISQTSRDKPHRPIQLDADLGFASNYRQSIVHYVSNKFSQDEKFTTAERDMSSKTSVIDAILGTRWSQPRTDPSQESHEEVTEDSHRCQPKSLLFYPHYMFGVFLRQLRRHSKVVRWIIFFIWVAYVTYAVVYNFYITKADYDWCHHGGLISWTSVVIMVYLITSKVIIPYAHHIHSFQTELQHRAIAFVKRMLSYRYVRVLACILAVIVIVMATRIGHMIPTMKQLTALCGYFVILLVAYLLSVEPEEISWTVVVKNLLLQVLVVYLMMVWTLGRVVLECMASKIDFLFGFSKKASWVLFSMNLPHMLSIELLSSLTLTGSIMHLLYYTGMLQGFLHKTGIFLELITGTTTVEAISGALCTLFGGIETAVILEPYIVLLTMSELHTFITSGIASMTGVALAMYMDMGVDSVTLMTVNFATFNGVLAVSKVMYPETDTSVTTYRDLKFMDRDEYNAIDAAVRGAIAVLRLLAQLVAVLIAFIALVNMGNDFIEWLLHNIGIPGMDLVGILSMVLRPLIFLMGIDWQSTGRIARFFATKTVLNENFGYQDFLKENKLKPMKVREIAVTVALLYGFSNLAHVGATVAYLTALAPERRHDISSTVPRALLTAILTNLLTAALVGALVFSHSHPPVAGQESFNASRPLSNGTLHVSNHDFFQGINGTVPVFHH